MVNAPGEGGQEETRSFRILAPGSTLSHYRIIEKIGAGGMGEVYLAEDTELDRKVALKVLPPHLCHDDECRMRFKREAQAAAKLNHPNIIHVYEVSEYQGRPFLAMEYVDGRSLAGYASDRELEIAEILELGIQVCEGLNEAHETGVTHRDIKPSNVLVDSNGRAKIVDFGLAAVAGADRVTRTGTTLGTIGYMSPEQVQGREADHRSDLFSLGVILYELITRRNPFKRDSEAATFRAVSDETPHPVARYRAEVPDGLQSMMEKLLEKDPALRYQHASDLAADLKRLTLAVGFGARRPDKRPSLAVLPFEDMSREHDQQYLCDGLTEELISALACVRDLRVVSRTSSFSFRDSPQDIRDIGRQLNVSTIVEGSVRKAGNRIRVTAQLIEAETGYHLWSGKYDREMEDVFAIEDDVTASIVSALRPELLKGEVKVSKPQTANMEAYNEYLLGLALWNKRTDEGLLKSLDHFKRAVDLDPAYTMAYCGISAAYNVMAGYCVIHSRTGLQKSMEAAQKALEIDPNSGEAHGIYAMNLWELNQAVSEAEREFRKALDLSPNSTHTMSGFVEMLTGLGRFDEASQLTERELGLDPLGWNANMQRITLALYASNIEVAELLTHQMLDIKSDFLPMLRMQCRVLIAKGDLGKASTVAAKALEIAGEHPMYLSQLGYVSGLSGDHTAAVECLGRLKALQTGRFVPSYERALVYLGMENFDEALGELENSIEEGYCRILTINVDPIFGPLKEMPRFKKIVKSLNLV